MKFCGTSQNGWKMPFELSNMTAKFKREAGLNFWQ
jgi:hypothetical protein